ncbi:MAG: hypothetical protein PHU64_07270 [Candidatus Omnitrophica bacterium]|nr:hypothetical protein [Candidatus Omnitrophota bacterium]
MTAEPNINLSIGELTEKVQSIIGTELVTIAKNAPSPRQAAILASHFGYNKEMIQATRWGAIIKRGERQGIYEPGMFDKILGPCIVEDNEIYDIKENRTVVEYRIYDPVSNKLDSLNFMESLQLLNSIKKFIYEKYGSDVHIIKHRTPRKTPYKTDVRWGVRHG